MARSKSRRVFGATSLWFGRQEALGIPPQLDGAPGSLVALVGGGLEAGPPRRDHGHLGAREDRVDADERQDHEELDHGRWTAARPAAGRLRFRPIAGVRPVVGRAVASGPTRGDRLLERARLMAKG
jgi:hypothetical protein